MVSTQYAARRAAELPWRKRVVQTRVARGSHGVHASPEWRKSRYGSRKAASNAESHGALHATSEFNRRKSVLSELKRKVRTALVQLDKDPADHVVMARRKDVLTIELLRLAAGERTKVLREIRSFCKKHGATYAWGEVTFNTTE